MSQGRQKEVQWEERYRGYCVSSHVICTEHHGAMISPVVLVRHPSRGVAAWILCPKRAKQHLLSPNSHMGKLHQRRQ